MSKLTHDRVVELLGRNQLDDHTLVEILGTGATDAELVEAINRVTRGGEVGAEAMRPISRTVAALCEILSTAMKDLSEPE